MESNSKLIHWIPRILCILAILFISIFALDSFSPELSFWPQVGGFFIHLIPSLILLILLIFTWKREFIGGIIFTLVGLVLTPFIFSLNYRMNNSTLMSIGIVMLITFPFIIVGILFIISHFIKKK